MATDTDCQTLAAAIDDLARRGFTESLAVVGNELHTIKTPKTLRPDEVVIREYRRFEGVSDPDDMSIVYAIETEGGIRGTLVDVYGVYVMGHGRIVFEGTPAELLANEAVRRERLEV